MRQPFFNFAFLIFNFPSMDQLKPNQRLAAKPFTDIENSQQDLAYLEIMRTALPSILATLPGNSGEQVGQLMSGHKYRVITTDRASLLTAPSLFAVGFCGTRVPSISTKLMDEMNVVDSDLVAELYRHPAILCYASIQIENSNWRNLVLLANGEGVAHWRESLRHIYATDALSPRYYTYIRLHNGQLDQGLCSERFVLHSTKYYDFSTPEVWRAIRPA